MIFEPPLQYPIKTLDLPAGGTVYSAPALRMVYDFVGLSVGATSPEDDEHGVRTIEYLTRCRRVMQLLLSNHASSLGLHPAVYFYSWTGKQQPILFLTMASLIVEWERARQLPLFITCGKGFETFLMSNRSLLNQVIRKFGTKDSGTKHLLEFYQSILDFLSNGLAVDEVIIKLQQQPAYAYLQPAESAYEGVAPTKFSMQVKSGLLSLA